MLDRRELKAPGRHYSFQQRCPAVSWGHHQTVYLLASLVFGIELHLEVSEKKAWSCHYDFL